MIKQPKNKLNLGQSDLAYHVDIIGPPDIRGFAEVATAHSPAAAYRLAARRLRKLADEADERAMKL